MPHSNVKVITLITSCLVPRLILAVQDMYSAFPLPASVLSASNGRTNEDNKHDVQAAKHIHGVVDHTADTSWRPNFFTVHPEDRWKGLVDQFDQSPSLQSHENTGRSGQYSRDCKNTTRSCLPAGPTVEKENITFSLSTQNIEGECCALAEHEKRRICEPAVGRDTWRRSNTGESAPYTATEVAAALAAENTLVSDSSNRTPNFATDNMYEACFPEAAVAVGFPEGSVERTKQSTEAGSWLEPGNIETVLDKLADRLRQIRQARLAGKLYR